PAGLRISVADNGIGISDEAKRHIFESFRQAAVSTTRRFGGTGLGVAICQRLVGLMGGTISAEGAPDEGATFIVRLPFEAVADATGSDLQGPSGLAEGPDLRAYLGHTGHASPANEASRSLS